MSCWLQALLKHLQPFASATISLVGQDAMWIRSPLNKDLIKTAINVHKFEALSTCRVFSHGGSAPVVLVDNTLDLFIMTK